MKRGTVVGRSETIIRAGRGIGLGGGEGLRAPAQNYSELFGKNCSGRQLNNARCSDPRVTMDVYQNPATDTILG